MSLWTGVLPVSAKWGACLTMAARNAVEIVIRKLVAQLLGQRAQDGPVRLGFAGREGGALGALHPALEIDVEAILFRIGGARQDHIGMMGAGIAMAALIDHEGAAQMGDVEFVGAQKIDKVDLALLRAIDDARDVAAALAS